MYSNDLPSITKAKQRYDIAYEEYGILMYHPVTTEINQLEGNIREVVDAVIKSGKKYVVIYPNNDEGSQVILNEYIRLERNNNFRIFPSIRFEYFLTLLCNADFIIGNSSAGIREAEVYGVPAIDIGSRQQGRYDIDKSKSIIYTEDNKFLILSAIKSVSGLKFHNKASFGKGDSAEKFMRILEEQTIWERSPQKHFVPLSIHK
jgi:UDP-N-acetylglucosamine 2-epimerase (hydrolysing)